MKCTHVLLTMLVTLGAGTALHATPRRIAASYFGGSGKDELIAVRFSPAGELILMGHTESDDLPLPSDITPVVWGTDLAAPAYTTFIARLSNDGSQLLSYARFAWGLVFGENMAVSDSGIYLVGYGGPGFAALGNNYINDDPESTGSFRCVIVRLSLDGVTLLESSFLNKNPIAFTSGTADERWDNRRNTIDIDLFPNGDLLVAHDKPAARFDFLSRIDPQLTTTVWHRWANYILGSNSSGSRTQTCAVAPDGQTVYMGGYGMGNTGYEPYKDPFLFKFSGDGATWHWQRSTGTYLVGSHEADYGLYNFPQSSIGANRLTSDSRIQDVTVDAHGNPCFVGYSDGGATVFRYDPMWGGYERNLPPELGPDQQDGDLFTNLGGANSVSTIGRLKPDGSGFVMSHRVRPPDPYYNRMHDIQTMANDKFLVVGVGRMIPNVEYWELSTATGVIMKLDLAASGTVRELVTHVEGVSWFNESARDRDRTRYAVVGYATNTGAVVPNAVQPGYGGNGDGFVVVFDDDESAVDVGYIPPEADAQVSYGSAANYGTEPDVQLQMRSGDPGKSTKGYFRWDLSHCTEPITGVRLKAFNDNRYGFGTLRVYGLDDGLDDWSETGITWDNAPANVASSTNEIDQSQSTLLGEWTIPRINQTGTVYFESDELLSFIETARTQGDRKVSIAVTMVDDVVQGRDLPTLTFVSKEGAGSIEHPVQLRIVGGQSAVDTGPIAAQSPQRQAPTVCGRSLRGVPADAHVEVYTLKGTKVARLAVAGNGHVLLSTPLPSGSYIARVEYRNARPMHVRVVFRR